MASMSFAGVSVVGEVRPPQSASATTAVTYSGYHLLVVNGYSSLVKDIPNGEWTFKCYPNGYEPEHDDYMSFHLFLDQGNVVDPVMVQYEFSFVGDHVLQNQNYNPALLDGAKKTLRFFSRDPYKFSVPCLTKRKKFEKSKYLKNDSFTIRCDIVITKDVDINEAGGTVRVSNVLPPPPDIGQDLGDLLQSGAGADVTFQVGGTTFTAHRCVLAARSAVFKAQLFGPMKEGTTTGVVHVRDMEEQVFKLLLDFIYSDSISLPDVDDDAEEEIMWQQLLEAADRYDLPRLKLTCEQELCESIDPDTVVTNLALAEQHHCRGLKAACLDFLNCPVALQQIGYYGLEPLVTSCPSVLKDLIFKLASKIEENDGDSSTATLPPVIDVPESDLHLHFSSLVHSEERTDVTFQVGGETFRAHRCVLAARSAVFRAELLGPMKDTASDVICLDDIEARVFKLLLTFIYSDSVSETKEEEKEKVEGNEDDADSDVMWQQLLVAADRYGIQRLRLMCEVRLGRYINTNTVATILALAEQHHCRRLKEECLDFLDCPIHLKQVMAVGGLDHLSPSVLIDLVAKLAAL